MNPSFRPILGAALFGASALTGLAATFDFTATSGAWENSANWSPVGLPGSGDFARISDNDGAILTSARTVATVQVSNVGSLEISGGGSLSASYVLVFGSILNNRSLFLSGGSLSVQGSPGILAVPGRMDATAGSSVDARRMELTGSDVDLRISDSQLTVDDLFVDALTAPNLPAGKMQFTDSTVTTRQSEFIYGVVNLTRSTWNSNGTMVLGNAPLTLSSDSTMNLSALSLRPMSTVSVNVNSGSRLRIDALSTGPLVGGSFTLTDGTLANGGNIVNVLPVTVAGASTIDSGLGVFTQLGSLSGTTLTKTGEGSLNLGATANSLTTVRIAEGVLQVGSGAVLTPGTMILGSEGGRHGIFRLSAGGTLRMQGLDTLALGDGTGELNLNGGFLDITGAFRTSVPITLSGVSLIDTRDTTATLNGVLSGAGELQKTGDGTLFLTANNTHTGGTTMYAGTIEFGAGGLGTGRVRPLGGTLRWAAGNTEDISNRLEISSAGGTLDLQANDVTFASAIATSGPLTKAGSGTLQLTANASVAALRIAGGSVHVGSGGALTTGELILGSQTGASGNFRLGSGGALNVGGSDGIRLGPGGGSFQLAGGLLKVTNSSLTTSVDMVLSSSSLIDTSGVTATLSGVLSGDGTLSKTGAGTLLLTSNNIYTGGTVLYAGTLQVDGAVGNVSVQPGAQLTGNGRTEFITLESGAILAPGDGIGTLSGSGLAWHAGAELRFELGPDSSDRLLVDGAFENRGSGSYVFDFVDADWEAETTYTLVRFLSTDFTVGDFSYRNSDGFAGTFALSGDRLTFYVSAVPEPSTTALAIAGIALLGSMGRRRFRSEQWEERKNASSGRRKSPKTGGKKPSDRGAQSANSWKANASSGETKKLRGRIAL